MKSFEIADFSIGYDDSLDESQQPPEATQNSNNTDYTQEAGILKKDFGTRVVSSVGLHYPLAGAIQGMYEGSIWAEGSGAWVNKRLVAAGGSLYWYCPGGYLVLLGDGGEFASGDNDYIDMTHYIDHFIITDGQNHIRKWSGFDLDLDILGGTENLYQAKRVEVFRNRLILGSTRESLDAGVTWTNYDSRWRYSEIGDDEDWSATGSNDIVDKAGDRIVRLKTLFDNCIVGKKNSVHSVQFTGGDNVFNYTVIDSKTINNAPWSFAQWRDGVMFLNEEGFQTTDGMNVAPFPADIKVTRLLKRLRHEEITRAYATSNDVLHQYICCVPLDGSTTNSYVIIYDWKYDTWKIAQRSYNVVAVYTNDSLTDWSEIADYFGYELQGSTWNNYSLYSGSKIITYGDTDGYVKERSFGYNDDGDAYNSHHETGWLDFKKPGIKKDYIQVQPTWRGVAATSVTLKYKTDYNPVWTTCIASPFSETGRVEQPFIGARANGNKIKFRIENNNADEYYAVYKLKIFYRVGSKR